MELNSFEQKIGNFNFDDFYFNYKYMVYTDYELLKFLNKLGPLKIIFDKKKRAKFY